MTPMQQAKEKVALGSIAASGGLTVAKAIVGVMTGSLAILSEAAHSLIDFAATVMTYIAVRMSGKPADEEHHYGHGKFESLAALLETALLFVLWGLLRIAADPEHPRRGEAIVVLVPTAVLVSYYLLTSSNPGGNAYGVRWFCLFSPLMYVFLPDAYAALHGRATRALFWTAYAVSIRAIAASTCPVIASTTWTTALASSVARTCASRAPCASASLSDPTTPAAQMATQATSVQAVMPSPASCSGRRNQGLSAR